MAGIRQRPRCVFGDEQALFDDCLTQSIVFFWIADIRTGAEHSDGAARQGQGRKVRLFVDADGQPGNHGDSRGGKPGGDGLGGAHAFPAAQPGADDAHAGVAEQGEVTPAVEAHGRVGEFPQQTRIAVVRPQEEGTGQAPRGFPFLFGAFPPRFGTEFADGRFPDARLGPARYAPHRAKGGTEDVKQALAASGPKPVRVGEGQRRPEFGPFRGVERAEGRRHGGNIPGKGHKRRRFRFAQLAGKRFVGVGGRKRIGAHGLPEGRGMMRRGEAYGQRRGFQAAPDGPVRADCLRAACGVRSVRFRQAASSPPKGETLWP